MQEPELHTPATVKPLPDCVPSESLDEAAAAEEGLTTPTRTALTSKHVSPESSQVNSEGRLSNMKSRHAILEQRRLEQEKKQKDEAEKAAAKLAQRKARSAAKKKEQKRRIMEETKAKEKEQQRLKAHREKVNREKKEKEQKRLLDVIHSQALTSSATDLAGVGSGGSGGWENGVSGIGRGDLAGGLGKAGGLDQAR